jgi:hypothetical protein
MKRGKQFPLPKERLDGISGSFDGVMVIDHIDLRTTSINGKLKPRACIKESFCVPVIDMLSMFDAVKKGLSTLRSLVGSPLAPVSGMSKTCGSVT